MHMTPENIEKTLFDLADIAELETMARFRKPMDIENKREKGFDPVTAADTKTEVLIRQYLAKHYPEHGIMGEEQEAINPDALYCWIIDPIDGTRAFISGLPCWGTLIGLSHNGTPIAGMMAQPFTGEYYFTSGGESWLKHKGETALLKTSNVTSLDAATIMTTDPFIIEGEDANAFSQLRDKTKLTRYGYDCYAYAMVAAGHIELVVETELNPYDILALIPIIENAGGIVTNWQGKSAKNGGRIIAAANKTILNEALETINRGK